MMMATFGHFFLPMNLGGMRGMLQMPNTTSAQKTLRFYPVNQSGMKGGSRKAYTIIHPRLIPISQPQ